MGYAWALLAPSAPRGLTNQATSAQPGLVVLNMRVAYNGTVWGEDFVLADTELIQQISGASETEVENGLQHHLNHI